MAHPPPQRTITVTLTDEEIAAHRLAADQRAAKVLEQHIDCYIAAQKLPLGACIEVSIGERGKFSQSVLGEVLKLYVAAGWGTASTTQDVPESLSEDVDGKPVPLDVSLVRWNGTAWVYKAEGETGIEYIVEAPRFTLTTKPDPRGIVLHLAP